jgi:outer membrane protein, heavy metal efflux system
VRVKATHVVLLAIALATTAGAAEPAATTAAVPVPATEMSDHVLDALVREALDRSPEYARARASVAADQERVPQVGSLPDPTLSLGIQNDGFSSIQIGTMETSFWQVMVTQGFPWPGKRGARAEAARAQARVTEAQLERIRLSTTAEVERAYVELLRIREQLKLQARLEALWKEADVMARTRYEVGQGTQSDMLRAQLERTRLRQQRIAIELGERTRVQALNRLRVHQLDEPIPTTRTLAEVGAPAMPVAGQMVEDAERRSPELAQARLAVTAAERRADVARRDRFPDFSVTAGVMPRGSLDPMWLASVGITLPIFSGSKQSRAVAESVSRREAEAHGQESIAQLVRLRAQEREAALAAVVETASLYKGGLLVQSDAAVRSTMGQYQVGRVTFASVLEVLRGLVGDESGYLDSLVQAQRLVIAQREVSLDPAAVAAAAAPTGSVPGAGGMGGGRGGAKTSASGGQDQPAAAPAGGGMPGSM